MGRRKQCSTVGALGLLTLAAFGFPQVANARGQYLTYPIAYALTTLVEAAVRCVDSKAEPALPGEMRSRAQSILEGEGLTADEAQDEVRRTAAMVTAWPRPSADGCAMMIQNATRLMRGSTPKPNP